MDFTRKVLMKFSALGVGGGEGAYLEVSVPVVVIIQCWR